MSHRRTVPEYALIIIRPRSRSFFFFFNDTATTEIYTLSLHDALPISLERDAERGHRLVAERAADELEPDRHIVLPDRKSTRLNSSHSQISYAVFCLKKKNTSPYCFVIPLPAALAH